MPRYLSSIRPRFWAFIISGLVAALILLDVTGRSYLQDRDAQIALLEEELITLRETTADLDERLQYTYTDEYFEREARGRLGLIYEDETLFRLAGSNDSAQ